MDQIAHFLVMLTETKKNVSPVTTSLKTSLLSLTPTGPDHLLHR